MMQALFDSGHAADFVLAVLALEGLWLARKGWTWTRVALALGPAVFIVLAVRAALVGAEWHWIALALMASFPLHLIDMRQRFEREKR
ncbi:MAG: hypothetical protein AAF291_16505 [Pseudomonadota bacterium]